MFLSCHKNYLNDCNILQHTLDHDIVDMENTDEFLAVDAEDCVHAMIGNAGCFY